MTFRRRLLLATVTLGGGICCFQPIMRTRMESRLSDILKAKVEIGSSKISLVDGTISLRDVVVYSADMDDGNTASRPNLNRIPQASLKFDWNSLFYRNMKVNSVVATDVHWLVAEPTSEFIPFAAESSSQKSTSSASNDSDSLVSVIEPILQPIKLKITEESAKQSQKQLNVSTQIREILQRIADAMPRDGSLNVLRQTSIVEESKKQLVPIKQAMAEDRVARKEAEKILASMRQTASKKLIHDLGQFSGFSHPKVTDTAVQMAKNEVAKEWNRNRSVLQLALQTVTALREAPALGLQTNGDSASDSNRLQAEFASRLPVGFTRMVAGKARGSIQFTGTPADSSDANSFFELQFKNLSSRDFEESDKPAVILRLTRDSLPSGQAWLTCSVQEMEYVQSDSSQYQVVVQRQRDSGKKSITTIQHANQGWSATVSIPVQNFLDLPTPDAALASPSLNNESQIIGKLIGTSSALSGDQNELLIEIEPSSIERIESVLKPKQDLEAKRKLAQAEIRGTEQLSFELQKIDARWEQLGDEHTRSHESWDASLKDINSQFEKLESAFKRTTRATTGRTQ